jgi:4-hydroxythreonine-4-phosphate dehydrogenase
VSPSTNPTKPTIAITLGDPGGIGPEIVAHALADRSVRQNARYLILGSASILAEAAHQRGIEPYWWTVPFGSSALDDAGAHSVVVLDTDRTWGPISAIAGPTKSGGAYSYRLIEEAIAMCQTDGPHRANAIVTAPISKEAWTLAGKTRFPGHTELLADRFGVKRVAMMFVGPALRVVLATVHIPLMEVRNRLTIGRVLDTIELGAQGCRTVGITNPRIAVCGLNPHAGEAGILGDEETRLIEPAIAIATEQGINASGPFPADTIFNAALAGKYDLVVAMYHDQGLIPVKLIARDESVNMTVGLPVIRTSPDHGTAFDIAGKGKANSSSMRAAIMLAAAVAAEPGVTHG